MKRVLGTPLGEYLPAALLLVLTCAYLAIAYRYKPDSRAMPVAVAWAMIALVGLDLAARTRTWTGERLIRWLNPAADAAQASRHKDYPAGKQLAAMLWILGFAAALVLVGVLYAVPLYVFASMRLRGGRSSLVCLAAAGGATLVIWLLFSVLLRLELFPGLLFGGS